MTPAQIILCIALWVSAAAPLAVLIGSIIAGPRRFTQPDQFSRHRDAKGSGTIVSFKLHEGGQ